MDLADAPEYLAPALTLAEMPEAALMAGPLFRKAFGHEIPAFPRHFVALIHPESEPPALAAYIHFTDFADVWLCGGLCVANDSYNRVSQAIAANWKQAGGIGEILLRATFAKLADRIAIFGFCGDERQWRHDINVGFVPAGPMRLLVHWDASLSRDEQAEVVARVAALGPF